MQRSTHLQYPVHAHYISDRQEGEWRSGSCRTHALCPPTIPSPPLDTFLNSSINHLNSVTDSLNSATKGVHMCIDSTFIFLLLAYIVDVAHRLCAWCGVWWDGVPFSVETKPTPFPESSLMLFLNKYKCSGVIFLFNNYFIHASKIWRLNPTTACLYVTRLCWLSVTIQNTHLGQLVSLKCSV